MALRFSIEKWLLRKFSQLVLSLSIGKLTEGGGKRRHRKGNTFEFCHLILITFINERMLGIYFVSMNTFLNILITMMVIDFLYCLSCIYRLFIVYLPLLFCVSVRLLLRNSHLRCWKRKQNSHPLSGSCLLWTINLYDCIEFFNYGVIFTNNSLYNVDMPSDLLIPSKLCWDFWFEFGFGARSSIVKASVGVVCLSLWLRWIRSTSFLIILGMVLNFT